MYLPSLAGPLDTLDFSEFLLVLRESTGFWDGFERLVQYYGSQGRVNAVIYGLISMNYELFGTIPQGWHLVRFGQMCLVVIAAFLVLRRMGTGRGAAWLGAALFTVWGSATAAWLRQTAEPAGSLLFLTALWLACGYAEGSRWAGRATGLTLAVLGMLFAKETFVVLVPVVLLAAFSYCSRGSVRRPKWTARSRALVAGSLVATIGLGAALAAASRVRRPAAYADLYGTGTVSVELLVDRISRAMLPVSLQVESLHQLFLFPPNLVFLIALFGGGAFAVVAGQPRPALAMKLGVGLLLPVLCAVVYLPWPRFELFYGLPFLFGVPSRLPP